MVRLIQNEYSLMTLELTWEGTDRWWGRERRKVRGKEDNIVKELFEQCIEIDLRKRRRPLQ